MTAERKTESATGPTFGLTDDVALALVDIVKAVLGNIVRTDLLADAGRAAEMIELQIGNGNTSLDDAVWDRTIDLTQAVAEVCKERMGDADLDPLAALAVRFLRIRERIVLAEHKLDTDSSPPDREFIDAVTRALHARAILEREPESHKPLRSAFNAKSQPIVDGIKAVFEKFEPPLTVRQVYYQLASSGLVPLSLSGYHQAQRLQLKLRELGIIPWDSYADRGRERIKPSQWDDPSDFADTIQDAYRKDLWQSQPEHVEFWLEKDALSAFVKDALAQWGNPLCVVRGFSSATFVYECAEILKQIEKPKQIYFLGDHDPSGLSIEQSVRDRLDQFGAEFSFERLAINLADIKTYDLRPLTAKSSDSRYEKYVAKHGRATVEIDALPPDVLRDRIQAAVRRHIDVDAWQRLQRVERVEQESIRSIADRMRGLA